MDPGMLEKRGGGCVFFSKIKNESNSYVQYGLPTFCEEKQIQLNYNA